MGESTAKTPRAGLNPKQRRFALEYLVDLCGKQAAIRAGYSAKTAESMASRLLRNVKVAKFLGDKVKKLEEKKFLVVEKLEEELDALCHLDPADLFDADGKLLAIRDMPERTRKALVKFEDEALFDGSGQDRCEVGRIRKLAWQNKVDAIALAMKRRGLLVEKHELELPRNVSIRIGVRSREKAPAPSTPAAKAKP